MRNWLWRHLPCVGLCKTGNAGDAKEIRTGSVQPQQQYYNSKNQNNRKNYNMDAEEEEEGSDDDEDEESLSSNSHIRDSSAVSNPISKGTDSFISASDGSSASKTKSILIPSKMDGKIELR